MTTPDFVVIGHVVRDLIPQGWRVGGTATFAAIQAQRLGLRAGLVTRVGAELAIEDTLPDIAVAGRPSSTTTSFENVYDGAKRRQRVPAQAGTIEEQDIPAAWREAPMVLLGPVCGEVRPGLEGAFPRSLIGVAAQGWLRELDRERTVRRRAWTGAPFWRGCRVLFVSAEDLGRRRDQLERWSEEVPIVALTSARRGARLHTNAGWQAIEAFPVGEVDPTGAGDVFAAAFLVRYHETEEIAESARFASAAAACSVEASGIERIADREEIEARMAAHPEIVLA
ncbi:MAG: ribokinase [Chloroflexi bacterium]|nr:ribokinase [Chloroflexota bacterium]